MTNESLSISVLLSSSYAERENSSESVHVIIYALSKPFLMGNFLRNLGRELEIIRGELCPSASHEGARCPVK